MILRNATQFFFIIFLINSLQIFGSTKSPCQQCGTPRSPLAFVYNKNNAHTLSNSANNYFRKSNSNLLTTKEENHHNSDARFFTQIPYKRQQNNE